MIGAMIGVSLWLKITARVSRNLIDKIFEPFFSTKGTNGLVWRSAGNCRTASRTIEVDMAQEAAQFSVLSFRLNMKKKSEINKIDFAER